MSDFTEAPGAAAGDSVTEWRVVAPGNRCTDGDLRSFTNDASFTRSFNVCQRLLSLRLRRKESDRTNKTNTVCSNRKKRHSALVGKDGWMEEEGKGNTLKTRTTWL